MDVCGVDEQKWLNGISPMPETYREEHQLSEILAALSTNGRCWHAGQFDFIAKYTLEVIQ